MAQAHAGAPFSGVNGEAVRILMWDRKHPTHPILAIEEAGDQEAVAFRVDGTADHRESLGIVGKLVMLPLGLIDGKPVFVGDEIEDGGDGDWTPGIAHPCNRDFKNCRWPEPAKVYPMTTMTNDDLWTAQRQADSHGFSVDEFRSIADAALRHAIDAGQVVPVSDAKPGLRPHCPYTGKLRDPRDIETDPMGVLVRHVDEPLRGIEGRATRDLAIAEAVRTAALTCNPIARGYEASEDRSELWIRISSLDLLAIISTIK